MTLHSNTLKVWTEVKLDVLTNNQLHFDFTNSSQPVTISNYE